MAESEVRLGALCPLCLAFYLSQYLSCGWCSVALILRLALRVQAGQNRAGWGVYQDIFGDPASRCSCPGLRAPRLPSPTKDIDNTVTKAVSPTTATNVKKNKISKIAGALWAKMDGIAKAPSPSQSKTVFTKTAPEVTVENCRPARVMAGHSEFFSAWWSTTVRWLRPFAIAVQTSQI